MRSQRKLIRSAIKTSDCQAIFVWLFYFEKNDIKPNNLTTRTFDTNSTTYIPNNNTKKPTYVTILSIFNYITDTAANILYKGEMGDKIKVRAVTKGKSGDLKEKVREGHVIHTRK